jgi:hypothetical protein
MKTKRLKKAGSAKVQAVTRRFLEALTGAREDAYRRVLDAIGLKRRDPKRSLTKAAKSSGTTLKTIRKYAQGSIQIRSGRFDVTASDQLPRRMRMLTAQGEVIVRTTSSRTASRIGDYNNALRKYVVSGDPSGLKPFEGKSVRSGGKAYVFATDRRTIDRFVRAGAVHFVDIYAPGSAS